MMRQSSLIKFLDGNIARIQFYHTRQSPQLHSKQWCSCPSTQKKPNYYFIKLKLSRIVSEACKA